MTAIWTVPLGGGDAVRLTGDDTGATQPTWSPDGRALVSQAYRDGNHLYAVRSDGAHPRQLTSGRYDHREPKFSPDGGAIAFSSDRGGTGGYGVFTLDVATGAVTARTGAAGEEATPDGRRVGAASPAPSTARPSTCSTSRPARRPGGHRTCRDDAARLVVLPRRHARARADHGRDRRAGRR